MFNETLPDVLSGSFAIDDLEFRVTHYGRNRHCTLRYAVVGKQTDTHNAQTQIVYRKVDANGYRGITVAVSAALRELIRNDSRLDRFRIPYSIAYLPDLKLLLTEAPSGEKNVKDLIAQRMKGENASGGEPPTLEEAIQLCAQVAAILHGSGIKLGRRRAITDEIQDVQDEFEPLQQMLPDLGHQFHSWLDGISASAKLSTPMPLCFNQGNLKCTQLSFDGQSYGLLDFDHVCQAEPALDLGQFLANLRLTIQEAGNSGEHSPAGMEEQLCELFLNSYLKFSQHGSSDEGALRDRVCIYENLSLIRLAAHGWRNLKGDRLSHALALLDKRVPR
jgi:hypothetical protein